MNKQWYSAAQLAAMKLPGLPGSERGMIDRTRKENWTSRQVPGKGGKNGLRTEYHPPKALMMVINNSLLMQQIEKDHQDEDTAKDGSIDTGRENGTKVNDGKRNAKHRTRHVGNGHVPTDAGFRGRDGETRTRDLCRVNPAGGSYTGGAHMETDPASVRSGVVVAAGGLVGLPDTQNLDKAQRECDTARKRLAEFVRDYAGITQAAINFLNNENTAGRLNNALRWAFEHAWNKPRGNVLSRDTLNKWVKRHKDTGSYAPRKIEKDLSIKSWHPLAITLCKRPQGSTKQWIHDQLVIQMGENAPSYDVMCRWFREDFSAIDQLKGRYSGSQLRSHKFYQHRTSEGLAPADEIHADGWNTHFTAPHPVTGEFVTYEVWHFHDVATRYVTQPGIGLTENSDVIAKGLENCIRELGVMVHLQTDSTGVVKGNDKFTKALHSLEERLGFTWVHPKEVGNSQANGIAENFNASWLDKRSRELATYQNKNSMDSLAFKRVKKITTDMVKAALAGDSILSDQKKREAERMGKGRVFISCEEARQWLRQIFAEYNDRPHRSLKQVADPITGKKRHQTPREALQEHIANGWKITRLDETELIDAFRPHVVVKVTRETVTPYGGMRFRNPDVLGHWNGKDVVVAYDMDNFDSVVVKDLKGELICVAEFVGATGYRGQTAREAGDEKRTVATLKRIDKKRETVLKRNPGVVIEHENVKTIVDFIDINAQPELVRELTAQDFLPAAKEAEQESSYSDTVMWLYGDQQDEAKEAAVK